MILRELAAARNNEQLTQKVKLILAADCWPELLRKLTPLTRTCGAEHDVEMICRDRLVVLEFGMGRGGPLFYHGTPIE